MALFFVFMMQKYTKYEPIANFVYGLQRLTLWQVRE